MFIDAYGLCILRTTLDRQKFFLYRVIGVMRDKGTVYMVGVSSFRLRAAHCELFPFVYVRHVHTCSMKGTWKPWDSEEI
jgi:hypothetical protein